MCTTGLKCWEKKRENCRGRVLIAMKSIFLIATKYYVLFKEPYIMKRRNFRIRNTINELMYDMYN